MIAMCEDLITTLLFLLIAVLLVILLRILFCSRKTYQYHKQQDKARAIQEISAINRDADKAMTTMMQVAARLRNRNNNG